MRHLFKSLFPKRSNQLQFRWQQLKYAGINRRFKEQYPEIPVPDAYTLYESYQLNYKKYMEDGELTANEILNSVKKYLPANPSILDWGCGPARITRHLKKFCPTAVVSGSDTNTNTIAWNRVHIKEVNFVPQNHIPPLPFTNEQFNLVIGFSVLTHIPAEAQQSWLSELQRILKPNGILWISTHGNHFIGQLSKTGKQEIREQGIYSTDFPVAGHRMMSTYHHPEKFKQLLEEKFKLLEYYDGATYPLKAGRQDLWVLRMADVGF
ncbi:MAG: class I SAM-dependent methyltransferase [Bacteroidota bacterium]